MAVRTRVILFGCGCLIGLALSPFLRQRPGAGITSDNFERISHGMTLADVERIVGDRPQPTGANAFPQVNSTMPTTATKSR